MPEEAFKPKVVLALIVKDGKFLLIRRKVHLINEVRWVFPGGTVGEAENEEQATVRHARSEAKIDVAIKEKLLERIHPDTSVKVNYFYCEPKGNRKPQIGEPHEIAEVAWVPASEVLEKFTSDVHPKIQEFVLSQVRSRK